MKNSKDYDVKKDRGQIQANLADTGYLSKDWRVKDTVTWAKCGKGHLTSKHDEWLKYAERNSYEEEEKEWKAKA